MPELERRRRNGCIPVVPASAATDPGDMPGFLGEKNGSKGQGDA
jgi:hypothetical protein